MIATLIMSTFTTPLGMLEVAHDESCIFKSTFTLKSGKPANNELAHFINTELSKYFANPHHQFQLPLKPTGSTYQEKVWSALLEIPAGHTLTYGELALKINSSPRAIGQACKRNPLVLFIPCHRIVGKK